jgi:metal-dependent amidase/aminoacylase/carboxypeptidase family protein
LDEPVQHLALARRQALHASEDLPAFPSRLVEVAAPGEGGERPLHHPCYDFNDDALPHGVRWFCAVAERALAIEPQSLTTP